MRDTSNPAKGRLFEIFQNKARKISRDGLAGKRPAGPLALGGMARIMLLYLPWAIFWVFFDIGNVSSWTGSGILFLTMSLIVSIFRSIFDIGNISAWISSGVPFILMSFILIYRVIFNRPVWPEVASWAFFLLAVFLAPIGQIPVFLTWGSIIGSLFMAGIWLISLLPLMKLPLSGNYSKWGFKKELWSNSTFYEINSVISLLWGWQFIVASIFGIAARLLPSASVILTVIRYGLLIVGVIFTSRYQRGAMEKRTKTSISESENRGSGHISGWE